MVLIWAFAVPTLCFTLSGGKLAGENPAIRVVAALFLAAPTLWLPSCRRRHLREAIDRLSESASAFIHGVRQRAAIMPGTAMRNALAAAQARPQAWTEELEGLLDVVGGAVFSVAPNGEKVLFASAQVHEIYGVAPETLCTSPYLWRQLIHPADSGTVARLIRQLRRSGCFEIEYRVLRMDGEVRWVRHRGRLQGDVTGRPQRITGIVTDISRQKARGLRLQASERWLAGLIQASMDGMVTVDQARCVVLYNPAAERMFGLPSSAVIGQPVDQLFAPSFHGHFMAVDEAADDDAGNAHFPLTVRGVRGDGSEFTMEATLARHAVGEQRFVTAMLRDITERLATETRLQQLSTAVEQSPVSIQITDAHCRICYVNKCYCTATGCTPEQVLGQSADIFNPGEMPDNEYGRLRSALASGREWCGEFHNRRPDGSLYWEFARIMPITDNDGRVAHFLVLKEDISEKKAMEERERQRQKQLAHSARLILLGEMSSSLAHEINQPLMAINGYSAACSRAVRNSPEALALLKKIDAQVTRAGEIVWRTRNFARRHSCLESVDLPTLTFSVMDWVSAEARRYEITLDTSGVDKSLPGIRADRLQIEQVLLNLLQNAFEALHAIDRPRCVAVKARHATGSSELVVSVEDTGCGMPTQVAPDVFQPFFTTKPSGLGLGLAISRSIIEDHGGKLWYATTAAGTSFHFSLPTEA